MSSNLRTPLYSWHVEHKARMVPFGGWDMPVQYSGIAPEHRAVRTAAGLFDISHMARFEVRGWGSLPSLERVFTNSVATMKDGQVRYGLVCQDDGGILDDILVYRWAGGADCPYAFSVVVNASNRQKILDWVVRHMDNTEIEDQTFRTTMVAVQGPKAVEICDGLLPGFGASGLKYYHFGATTYRGSPCIVSRTGYTGEDGFEIIVPNALAVTLWEEILARGAVPCGLGARDTLRLEAAMPLYGHELNETIDPIRAGLAWAVKLDKGEFIGREALREAAASAGQKSQRVGLEVEGKRAAREGSAILGTDNTPAGTVTSGSFTPWLEKSIAMGYVEPKYTAPGTKLVIDVRGSVLNATVVPLPFYKRKK
ncbi:MAG TPA: glycine cleavage system aminomethyltransferase GcvT [Gemmataceae bacterium]|nr:glycine cleavage system aminomethyltransferase GcvT [Gemmataceae bacterium]